VLSLSTPSSSSLQSEFELFSLSRFVCSLFCWLIRRRSFKQAKADESERKDRRKEDSLSLLMSWWFLHCLSWFFPRAFSCSSFYDLDELLTLFFLCHRDIHTRTSFLIISSTLSPFSFFAFDSLHYHHRCRRLSATASAFISDLCC
jgi:hypothetical protein